MAFNRFVIIRFPLHYATILTYAVISNFGAAVLLCNVMAVLPVSFLIKRLLLCPMSCILPSSECHDVCLC